MSESVYEDRQAEFDAWLEENPRWIRWILRLWLGAWS